MRHRIGTLLVVVGLGTLAWAATVYLWKDPFTALYTAYEQRRLETALDETFERWKRDAGEKRRAIANREGRARMPDVRRQARAYRLQQASGDALARLEIPRLGVDAIVVNGTTPADLRRGPGRHLETSVPGERELVYVAGHRTTYGAPFSDIDDLRPGDEIRVELPYATFTYRVTSHRIVDDNDLSVLESRGREELVLQACHPRFFASQRYLVYARPVSVRAHG